MTDTQITQADRDLADKLCCDAGAGHMTTPSEWPALLAAHRLATRTDATPVAWMDLLANAYAAGAEDVHKAWIEGTASSEPDFGEAASDYARSIDFPPATDVAALVEAAKEAARGFDATNLLIEAVSGSPSIMVETFAERLRQALAPFTKGQNDDAVR